MILKPVKQNGSIWKSYTGEFGVDVWLCVIFFVLTGTLCIHVVTNYHPTDNINLDVGESFILSLGALTAQSKPKITEKYF